MKSIAKSHASESQSRLKFEKQRCAINVCLASLASLIILVPITYILRLHYELRSDQHESVILAEDERFLALEIQF